MLIWKNAQPFSARYGDVYFSTDSGLEETRHVFLQGNDLAQRFAALQAGESFCIGETGFGTALNFLCAWQLFGECAPQGASLDFFSVEKFPLNDDELRTVLLLWPELQAQAEALLACWQRRVPGWNRWNFAGGRVRLTIVIDDVEDVLPQLPAESVDAWFLDGFSPAKNAEMWSDHVMENIARASRAGATLATYTSAGWVRRALQQAGFAVEKAPGFGRKREMVKGQLALRAMVCTEDFLTLHGEYSRQAASRDKTPRTAIIIGGGIAGCAAAHALVQCGIAVTLIEREPHLASAASGNPRGIMHARFGAGDEPLQRFVLAAYGHTLSLLDRALAVDGVNRAECGLLQLACNSQEEKRISRLAEQEWPPHLLQFVDAAHATQRCGVDMKYGGLWFPAGGWVVPPVLCERLVDDCRIARRFGLDAEILEKTDDAWNVSGHDANGTPWQLAADVVIVCCAHSAKKLSQFAQFPLTTVRGQITLVASTLSSQALQAVVCGDGYCAPAVEGEHILGATHAFGDESTEVRASDHAENLAKLGEYAPQLRQEIGAEATQHLEGRASLRCSAPGSMPMVGEVEPGLYCSLAHGTRGLLTAGLAGEVLAAQICGQLPPLPSFILDALAPLPRVRNKG